MHDHEFERQVHDSMEGLHLSPSDAVWTRVRGQLHKKERRRRFLWIPLFLVALGLGGYFFAHYVANPAASAGERRVASQPAPGLNPPISSRVQNDPERAVTAREQHATTTSPSHTPQPPPTQPAATPPAGGPAAATAAVRSGRAPSASTRADAPVLTPETSNAVAAAQDGHRPAATGSNPGAQHSLPQQNPLPASQSGLPATGASPADSLQDDPAKDPAPYPLTAGTATLSHTGLSLKAPNATHAVPQVLHLKRNGLEWGVTVSGTRTSAREGKFISLLKSTTANDVNTNFNTIGSGTPPSNGSQTPVPAPVAVTPGWGFTAGGFLRKKVSPRIAFSGGLQYALYTTSMVIGARVDSTRQATFTSLVNSYYPTVSRSRQAYVNRYHFLEMPLAVEMQLNKNTRMPLVLTTGLTLSRLLSTNALHYSTLLGAYYKDDSLFHRTQASLHAGIDLQLFSRTAHPLRIGPQVQYAVSRLVPAAVNSKNHLLRYEIRLSTVW